MMPVNTISDQYPVSDSKPLNSGIPTPIAEPVRSEAHDNARYEALWIESEKVQRENQKDLYKWLRKLKSELGGDTEIRDYYQWVQNRLSPPTNFILKSHELAIDLKKASWIEGNYNLRHLNSLLFCSITQGNLSEDLGTYQGYSLGLQIHGQPLALSYADAEQYADKGIIVNSTSVLALGYYAHIDSVVKTEPEKTFMIFTPLGRILARSKSSRQWAPTGLVLIAEIRDNGKAGSLYLIFPPDNYGHANSVMMPEWSEMQRFRSGCSFTIAKLQDNFALLENEPGKRGKDLVTTVISKSPVEIVQTGTMITGEPGIPFALNPAE